MSFITLAGTYSLVAVPKAVKYHYGHIDDFFAERYSCPVFRSLLLTLLSHLSACLTLFLLLGGISTSGAAAVVAMLVQSRINDVTSLARDRGLAHYCNVKLRNVCGYNNCKLASNSFLCQSTLNLAGMYRHLQRKHGCQKRLFYYFVGCTTMLLRPSIMILTSNQHVCSSRTVRNSAEQRGW